MRRTLSIGRYDVTLSTTARRAWNDFKVFPLECGGRHIVWGRLSLMLEDGCTECIPTCTECGSREIGEVSSGDEGWTVCQACRSVERGYVYLTKRGAERQGVL